MWRHTLGSRQPDVLVFEEADDAFYVHVGCSRDKQMVLVTSGNAVTNETRFVRADAPLETFQARRVVVEGLEDPTPLRVRHSHTPSALTPFHTPTPSSQVILPRETDVECDVEHWHGSWVIVKRTAATPNSEVIVCPVANPAAQRVLLVHDEAVKIEDIAVSERFAAVFVRTGGLQEAQVYALPADKRGESISLTGGRKLEFSEPAYDLGLGAQGDFDSDVLAISYTSLTTPPTTFWQHMASGAQVVKKVRPVLGGFEQALYATERIWATAPDGVKVGRGGESSREAERQQARA